MANFILTFLFNLFKKIAKIACVVEQIKGQANNDFTILTGAASFLLDAL